jgi:glycine/D-amino acid oxidase-like deaminating enzyme
MKSVWKDSVTLPRFDPLEGDLNTDVLIIGGGMAGVLCAYFLQQNNIDYALVEGGTICHGITQNTTAKITAQHRLIYDKLLKNAGREKAGMYLWSNQLAVEKYRKLCQNIDCDFEDKSAFVYTLDHPQKIEKEMVALEQLGYAARFTGDLPLPFLVDGAVEFPNQAQFNPLKFINQIVKTLTIYENTYVKSIANKIAETGHGQIKAKQIIIASHFPFINKHGFYFLKMYQNRSYVLGLDNAADVRGMYIDEDEKGLSFRNYKDLLLLGGGAHRTGKKGGNWRKLHQFATTYYPSSKEKYAWAAQDCMTLDSVPYIGPYAKDTFDLLVATGFNKWGMTSSMVAAMILTDRIIGKTNDFAEVFYPSRSILKPQILVNGAEAIVNLLTISGSSRCTHMGCSLKWNPAEQTWDCPCHGSRFAKNGDILDNPAMVPLEPKK